MCNSTAEATLRLLLCFQYCTQICRLGLLQYWTKECEQGIAELKKERKALTNLSRKFANVMNKLPSLLTRTSFRGSDEVVRPVHRLRLESLMTVSVCYCVTVLLM